MTTHAERELLRQRTCTNCGGLFDHNAAFRGPDPWYRQMAHTAALRRRQIREASK